MRNQFRFIVGLMILSLLVSSAAVAKTGLMSDPTIIGVGARALGMGKAFVAVAEDADAIFSNPSGLARISAPKLTSMYSPFFNNDAVYTMVGGAFPYGDKSAFGAGIINSRMSDITLTDAAGGQTGTGSWGNTVIFLSYGTYINGLSGLSLGRDVLLGASLKYASVGGDGLGVSDGTGSGLDIDLGGLYPVNESIMLGATLQNAIGSQIKKTSGSEDTLPRCLKVGTRVTLIGKEGMALTSHEQRKLYGSIDYDYYPNKDRDNTLHVGLEYWPVSNLALRAGMDGSDMTAGIGVRFSGVEFNYAYHPYSGMADNTTQYFSIGYLGENKKRELRLKLIGPIDKSVIYDDNIKISGQVEVTGGDDTVPVGPITVRVNGAILPVDANNNFSAEIPVEAFGKKLIAVEASDNAGNIVSNDVRLVRLTSFSDVPEGYWAKQPIENDATLGLVEGYPDGTFKPEKALTRAELAALLVRAKGIKPVDGEARKVYKDVSPGFWAAKYIEIAQREGLIKGYPDKTFRPNNKISKAEGIAVMVRFDKLDLAQVTSKPYWDIPTRHWAARHIQTAKDAGMLTFVEKNRLRPKDALVRSESVDMLSRTNLAGGKIKDLYSWEKGFRPGSEKMNLKTSLMVE